METGPIDGQHENAGRSNGGGQAKSSNTPKKTACLFCRAKKVRCDGAMPVCGHCARHSLNCQHATSRQKTGPKKGYLRSLESRLVRAERLFDMIPDAGLETCTSNAVHGVASATPMAAGIRGSSSTADQTASPHSSVTRDSSGSVDLSKTPTALALTTNSHPIDSYPSDECINELHQIYFSKIHPNIPIIHERRYLSTSLSVSSGGIPACLRYIIWSSAAAISDKYRQDENELYRRARELAQADEMSSYGESAVSLAHCQTWLLIGYYEVKRVLFPRAWLSIGKAVRLAQMLQLFRLDDPLINLKRIVHPPRDWAELEECRHVFWMAFCLDRYASMGTGWPTILDEEDIITNLPLSNESVDNNTPVPSTTLQQAYKLENVESLSAQTIVIILASIAGRNLKHLKRASIIGTSGQSYDFWDAHQDMDTSLLNLGLALPEHLRLPLGIEKPNVVFIHVMLHALTICLHQMAVLKAQKCGHLGRLGTESKERCVASALAITSSMRQANHTDIATMHIFTPFCLFVAARILAERVQSQPSISEYRHALLFLHQVLERLKKANPLAEIFLVQLRLADRAHRAEEQREEGNNIGKDKAQGDLPSSLSFTHSFHPIFDPREDTTGGDHSSEESITAESTAPPIRSQTSTGRGLNSNTNAAITDPNIAVMDFEAPWPPPGVHRSPNGTSSTTPSIHSGQIFSDVEFQRGRQIVDTPQHPNWMDLEMFPLLPFFPLSDGGHFQFNGEPNMWNSSSRHFAPPYDDRASSNPQTGRDHSYESFFGNDS